MEDRLGRSATARLEPCPGGKLIPNREMPLWLWPTYPSLVMSHESGIWPLEPLFSNETSKYQKSFLGVADCRSDYSHGIHLFLGTLHLARHGALACVLHPANHSYFLSFSFCVLVQETNKQTKQEKSRASLEVYTYKTTLIFRNRSPDIICFLKYSLWDCRDSSVLKSIYCSCGGLGFNSQHTCGCL